MQPGMGLRRIEDPRDRRFSIASAVEELQAHTRHWPLFSGPLSQGNTGTCVEHGWRHWAMTAPIISTKRVKSFPQYSLYREMVAIDEWDDNDVDPGLQFGTSVRAGAKVMRNHGFLTVFGWSDNVEAANRWISNFGPVVLGVNWYTEMMYTDSTGHVHARGVIEGGHCVALIGRDHKHRRNRGINSWGPGFGQNGRFWINDDDFARLIEEQGDVCTALEVRIP